MLVRTNVTIEEEDFKKLKHILIDKHESFSGLIKKWVSSYLEKTSIINPVIKELKTVMEKTEEKYSIHDYGPNGNGICFKCTPSHKQQR